MVNISSLVPHIETNSIVHYNKIIQIITNLHNETIVYNTIHTLNINHTAYTHIIFDQQTCEQNNILSMIQDYTMVFQMLMMAPFYNMI